MTGERTDTSTNTSNKAWHDTSTKDFWIPIQKINKMYKEETRKYKEKKITYKECMIQIETGSISLMVFVVNGVINATQYSAELLNQFQ